MGQYCSQTDNVCVPVGSCRSNDDCFDISNAPLAVNMCVGTLECMEGRCNTNCGVFPPSDEDNNDEIEDPLVTAEDNNNAMEAPTSSNLCNSNDDCADDEYCGRGSCVPTGQCRTNSDCHNPSNIYPAVLCVGHVSCNLTIKAKDIAKTTATAKNLVHTFSVFSIDRYRSILTH